MFGAKSGRIVNKELSEAQLSKKEQKERERYAKYMNSMVTRAEVSGIIDAYMKDVNRHFDGLVKNANIQNYLIEALKEELIAKGIFTEEELTTRLTTLAEEAHRLAEKDAAEKAEAAKNTADVLVAPSADETTEQ